MNQETKKYLETYGIITGRADAMKNPQYPDPALERRKQYLISVGNPLFADSAAVIGGEFGQHDIDKLITFYALASSQEDRSDDPTGPATPWRPVPMIVLPSHIKGQEKSMIEEGITAPFREAGYHVDMSYYPADALYPPYSARSMKEHFKLAIDGTLATLPRMKQYAKSEDEVTEPWAKEAVRWIQDTPVYQEAFKMGVHDWGRFGTHGAKNQHIAEELCDGMGFQPDIYSNIPDEYVLFGLPYDEQKSPQELEDEMYQHMIKQPFPILARTFFDNFFKGQPGTNRLVTRADLTTEKMWAWSNSYANRVDSGDPEDRKFKDSLRTHGLNETRLFNSLKRVFEEIMDVPFDDLVKHAYDRFGPELSLANPRVPFTSNDLLPDLDHPYYGRTVEVGGRKVTIEAITSKGTGKRENEDGAAIIQGTDALLLVGIDGVTQRTPLESLGTTPGGKYVTDHLIKSAAGLDTTRSAAENMEILNAGLRVDMDANHPDIERSETSTNVPAAAVALARVDLANNTLEVANVADVSIIAERNGVPELLTIDRILAHDRAVLAVAQQLARQHNTTVREVVTNRNLPQYAAFAEAVTQSVQKINTGEKPVMNGGDNFSFDKRVVSLEGVEALYMISDGAAPCDIDIQTPEGLQALVTLIKEEGLFALLEKRTEAAAEDSNWEHHQRTRDIDDMIAVKIRLSS